MRASSTSMVNRIAEISTLAAALALLLPAAATQTIPASTSLRTERHNGSLTYESIASAPKLMLSTRML